MSEGAFRSARAMLADLESKRVSARELLDQHLAQHEKWNGKLNAVIRTDVDRAKRDAQTIDDKRARGEKLGPLAGLPMTIKDGLDVEGLPAHAGAPQFVNRDANCADAETVRRTRAAGAVIWGKTNVPYMLADIQSFNRIYGTSNNPYDVTRTPGGSSGGAAAALATGMTPLEIGSDIGGSLRHPANFCGVFSCKPTWGLVPMAGHVPPPPGIDPEVDLGVVGPMARTAEDLRLLFRILTNTDLNAPAQAALSGMKVAVWSNEKTFPLAESVRKAVVEAGEALSSAGATVKPTGAPVDIEKLLVSYRDILISIVGGGIPRPPNFAILAALPFLGLARVLGAAPFSRAGYAFALTASPERLEKDKQTRDALKAQIKTFFETTDVILSPVTYVPAYAHNQADDIVGRTVDVDGKPTPYMSFLSWIALATALHLPAVVAPVARTAEGLPIGVQIIGPWGSEERLMDVAAFFEQRFGGFKPPV